MAFSPIFSSLLISLLLYTLLSAVSINSYPIQNICNQTKNPGFCNNLLGPHSSASLQDLELIVIDATLSSVTSTSAKIKSDLPKITDPNLIVVYSLCSNYYSAALSVLNVAKEKVKSGDFRDLNSASNTVATDASSCKNTFSFAPSLPIPFASDNSNFEILSDIFTVASKIISA